MTGRALPWQPPISPNSKRSHRDPSQERSHVDLYLWTTDPQEGLDHLIGHMGRGPDSAAPLLRMYTDKKKLKRVKRDDKYIPNLNCAHTCDDYNLKQ